MTALVIGATGQALIHDALDPATANAGSVRAALASTHAAIANLEASVVVEGAWPTKTKTLHLTAEAGIASLRELGLSVLTHANNHAFDLGPPGLQRTRAVAEGLGLRFAGSGVNLEEAFRPASVTTPLGRIAVFSIDLGPQPDIVYAGEERAGIAGLRVTREVRVPPAEHALLREMVRSLGDDAREAARARVGYAQKSPSAEEAVQVFGTTVRVGPRIESLFVPEAGDFERLSSALRAAAQEFALVAVAIHNHHWDADWSCTPAWLDALARALIDHGADLVVGTGAPVLQPIRFHKDKPILAGLGNLIFHTRRAATYDRESVDVWTGAVCRCHFDLVSRTCGLVELLPVAVGRPAQGIGMRAPAPAALGREAADAVFQRLAQGLDGQERDRTKLLAPEADARVVR